MTTRIPIIRLFLLSLVCLPLLARASQAQSKPETPGDIKNLEFFAGDWHCNGRFPSTGKEISANLHFEFVLGGKFLMFKHDDEPPFNYHAHAYWAWDQASGQYVSTIHDSMGGTRVFHSNGWKGAALEWAGGEQPAGVDQRFIFERLDDKKFRVTYSYIRNGGWVLVDTSVCTAGPK